MIRQQGQDGVRGGGGNDLQQPGVLELPEGADQVASASDIGFPRRGESVAIEQGQLVEEGLKACSLGLLLGKFK